LISLKLVKDLAVLMDGRSSSKLMVMGRWSELRRVWVVQVVERARWAEMREMSGEEEGPLLGRRVGESALRIKKGLLLMASAKSTPLAVEV
jgi:hypothetical protein